MPTFDPPPLTERVTIRDPAAPPPADVGAFGRVRSQPAWGIEVWAAVRDRAPTVGVEDDAEIRESRTIFTIRERDVAPDAEVLHRGTVYESAGPVVRRSGMGYGRLARYVEIHTRRKA